jgi:hypothetical protein
MVIQTSKDRGGRVWAETLNAEIDLIRQQKNLARNVVRLRTRISPFAETLNEEIERLENNNPQPRLT